MDITEVVKLVKKTKEYENFSKKLELELKNSEIKAQELAVSKKIWGADADYYVTMFVYGKRKEKEAEFIEAYLRNKIV